MGRTMIDGMLTSTFLTLLVVPLLYMLFDDLRIVWGRLTEQTFAKSQGKVVPAEDMQLANLKETV